MTKIRSTSRNRNKSRKSRRHYYHYISSDFEASITLSESTDSEIKKKKKKKPEKKPNKINKNKGHAHATISNSNSNNDNTYPIKAYEAMSDSGSNVDEKDIHAYIATAKNQGPLDELLKQARIMNGTVGSGLWQDYYQQKGTQSGGVVDVVAKQTWSGC